MKGNDQQLIKDALVAIQTLQRKCAALEKRHAELEVDLAKARGNGAPTVHDAIADALYKGRRSGSALRLARGANRRSAEEVLRKALGA
jgi:hypothetical protein